MIDLNRCWRKEVGEEAMDFFRWRKGAGDDAEKLEVNVEGRQ